MAIAYRYKRPPRKRKPQTVEVPAVVTIGATMPREQGATGWPSLAPHSRQAGLEILEAGQRKRP